MRQGRIVARVDTGSIGGNDVIERHKATKADRTMATENQPVEEQEHERKTQPIRKHTVKVNCLWMDDVSKVADLKSVVRDVNLMLGAITRHGKSRRITAINALIKAGAQQAGTDIQLTGSTAASHRLAGLASQIQSQPTQPSILSAGQRLQAAVAVGELEWGGGQFRPEPPSVTLSEGESLVDLLAEVRSR